MSSPSSQCSTRSPICEVPYDILLEIFIQCLPPRPLEIRQPNMTIAPMLLCQICSFWRTAALTSPTLWSHLSYRVTLPREASQPDEILQNEMDFILWWKEKQGSIAPSLRIDAIYGAQSKQSHLLSCPATDFLGYLTSAQYFQTDTLWSMLKEQIKSGYPLICPNLHTVATLTMHCYDLYAAQVRIGRIPNWPSSALRRVSIFSDCLPTTKIIPIHWSRLTHISFCNVFINLKFWYALMHAVPDLQWAYIEFQGVHGVHKYVKQ